MKYGKIVKGCFISRPNRFVAKVEIDGSQKYVHVKNTGRCKELLVPGATVYLEDFTRNMGARKFEYSLIAVEKLCEKGRKLLINMDSQAPNKAVKEALESGKLILPGLAGLSEIKPETVRGRSRLDFYVRDRNGIEGYIEVKGVTLENHGTASFPDAPTMRGIRHLNELSSVLQDGFKAYVVFVIQMMGTRVFRPDSERHAAFADALRQADKNGVNVLAYGCKITPDTMLIDKSVPVDLRVLQEEQT